MSDEIETEKLTVSESIILINNTAETTDEGQDALLRAQSRMEQYQRIVTESVTPETVAELPAPLPLVWPEDQETQNDADSGDELPLGNVEASVDAIYERYIQTKPDGKLTKDGIRQVFESLDLEYTARAPRRRLKTQNKQYHYRPNIELLYKIFYLMLR